MPLSVTSASRRDSSPRRGSQERRHLRRGRRVHIPTPVCRRAMLGATGQPLRQGGLSEGASPSPTAEGEAAPACTEERVSPRPSVRTGAPPFRQGGLSEDASPYTGDGDGLRQAADSRPYGGTGETWGEKEQRGCWQQPLWQLVKKVLCGLF